MHQRNAVTIYHIYGPTVSLRKPRWTGDAGRGLCYRSVELVRSAVLIQDSSKKRSMDSFQRSGERGYVRISSLRTFDAPLPVRTICLDEIKEGEVTVDSLITDTDAPSSQPKCISYGRLSGQRVNTLTSQNVLRTFFLDSDMPPVRRGGNSFMTSRSKALEVVEFENLRIHLKHWRQPKHG